MDENEIGRIVTDDESATIGAINPASLSGRAGRAASGGSSESGSSGDGNASGGSGSDSDAGIRFNKDGSPSKRRGRKPGSGAGAARTQKKNQANLGGLEAILLSAHSMLAMALKADELAIDRDEAKQLALAINEVQEYYDIKASQELMLWANVIGVAGAIYVPRFVAVYNNRKAAAEKKKQERETQKAHQETVAEATNVIDAAFYVHNPPEG